MHADKSRRVHTFDLIIHHGPCFDGFTAAWIAKGRFPDAVLHETGYHTAPPDVRGRTVLIADFSYPRDVLLRMADEAAHITVLDHHKTAAEDLGSLAGTRDDLEIIFDMERSGAGLTWDYLYPAKPRPPIVDHVEDRDLWRFDFDNTKAFHAAMACYPFTLFSWNVIHNESTSDYSGFVRSGRAVLSFIESTAQRIADRAVEDVLPDGTPCWSVNVPVELVAETGHLVMTTRTPMHVFLGWSYDAEKGVYYCSLRSRDGGPDVSALAKKFGGGGHRNAAAFRSTTPPPSWRGMLPTGAKS